MLGDREEIKHVQNCIKKSFIAVKEEMNMHLETINQNSSEIESIYDLLNELDLKMEKLNERIDQMQMVMNNDVNDFEHIDLTSREQEVFLVIYAENDCLSVKEIGRRLGFNDEMVNTYIGNMISKGIPIIRHYKNSEVFIAIDLKFKDLQTRKNVLRIDESVSKTIFRALN